MAKKKTAAPVQAYDGQRSRLACRRRSGRTSATRARRSSARLRIYTLDPSVSDRVGGVATVLVPYEKLAARSGRLALRGELRRCPGAAEGRGARPRRSAPAPLERPVADAGQRPLPPADGVRRLQSHLRRVQAGPRPGHRLGDHGARPTSPLAPRRATLRLPRSERRLQPRGRRPLVRLLHGAGQSAPASPCRTGIVCTALSHDIVAHETTHALLDGLRSAFLDPTNVDVPAFHEGFSDLVALFLHFTYADVVEQRDPRIRAAPSRAGRCSTDLAREFGYARSQIGPRGRAAFGSGRGRHRRVRLGRAAGARRARPGCYDPTARAAYASGPCWCRRCSRRSRPSCKRKTERFYRIAGIDPEALGRVPLSDALVKAIAQEA